MNANDLALLVLFLALLFFESESSSDSGSVRTRLLPALLLLLVTFGLFDGVCCSVPLSGILRLTLRLLPVLLDPLAVGDDLDALAFTPSKDLELIPGVGTSVDDDVVT